MSDWKHAAIITWRPYPAELKRRLNIIVALVHRPRLVLLDEPTVGVDLHSREQILQLVRELRDKGTAVLYTTHHMEEAQALCDCIAILHEGALVAEGRLDELLASLEYTDTIEIRGLPNDVDLSGIEALNLTWRAERHEGMVSAGKKCRKFSRPGSENSRFIRATGTGDHRPIDS